MLKSKPIADLKRTVRSAGDLAYVRENYRIVEEIDPRLPAPSYYDENGNAYVPFDYELQVADRATFSERCRNEIARCGLPYDDAWVDEAWDGYQKGHFGVCLRQATPENIVLKNALIDRIEQSLEDENRGDTWDARLRAYVNELDAIERPFCSTDRAYFGGSVSRDRYITAPLKILQQRPRR